MPLFSAGKFTGASAGFSIELDKSQWLKAQALLAGVKNGASRVIVRSVNKTLTGVRTDTVKEIRRDVNITATAIRKTMGIEKASVSRMSARVTSKQKYGTSLAAFGARQTTKGVTVQVLRRKSRSLIPHAFINKKPGGNVVFWRKNKQHVGIRPFRKEFPYARMPRKYRLPIEKLWGPAVPDLMKHGPTFKVIERKAKARLDKNFSHELDYMLSKL